MDRTRYTDIAKQARRNIQDIQRVVTKYVSYQSNLDSYEVFFANYIFIYYYYSNLDVNDYHSLFVRML